MQVVETVVGLFGEEVRGGDEAAEPVFELVEAGEGWVAEVLGGGEVAGCHYDVASEDEFVSCCEEDGGGERALPGWMGEARVEEGHG